MIFFGALILVAVAAIVALCLRPATVIGVSEKSLAYSVRGAADTDETRRCQEIDSDDKFDCEPPREGEREIATRSSSTTTAAGTRRPRGSPSARASTAASRSWT